jgi:hypothetical protein
MNPNIYTQAHYDEMLAQYGLSVGQEVSCDYRTSSANQWWCGNDWIGTIKRPSEDANEWNGYCSELTYCIECHKAKVHYAWPSCRTPHTQYDHADTLHPASAYLAMTASPFNGRKAS